MALPLAVLLPLLDGASDRVPAENDVKAGWMALLVFGLLVLAVVCWRSASASSCARRRPRASRECTATRRWPQKKKWRRATGADEVLSIRRKR